MAGGVGEAVGEGDEAGIAAVQLELLAGFGAQQGVAGQAQQDAWAGAGQGEGGAGETEHVQAELRGRGVEPGDAVGQDARREHRHGHRRVHELEYFGHVDVLAGQAGPDHVVGVGEQLDPGAAQVGVQAAGRHEHRLTWFQDGMTHQQQRHHAEIAGMVHGHAQGRGAGTRVGPIHGRQPLAGGVHPVDQLLAAILGPAENGLQHAAQVARAPLESGGERLQLINGQRPEDSRRVRGGAQPGQHLERRQGAQQFGLGPVIDVVPGRVAGRQPALVLRAETRLRLGTRGMHLDGQRPVGRQHLQQERQPGPEPGQAVRSELAAGIGRDDGIQGARIPVDAGRRRRVRAHPEFGLRTLGRDRPPLEGGDPVPRPPGVGPDDRTEKVHPGMLVRPPQPAPD